MVFMRRRRGTKTSQHSDVKSKQWFSFQSGSHQSSSHKICFLVIFANIFLEHNVALGPVQGYFAILKFQGLSPETCKVVPLEWQVWFHFKVAPFFFFLLVFFFF